MCIPERVHSSCGLATYIHTHIYIYIYVYSRTRSRSRRLLAADSSSASGSSGSLAKGRAHIKKIFPRVPPRTAETFNYPALYARYQKSSSYVHLRGGIYVEYIIFPVGSMSHEMCKKERTSKYCAKSRGEERTNEYIIAA